MFKTARIKLTLLHLAIITLISIFFSLVTYHLLSTEVDRFARFQRFRIEQRMRFENKFLAPDMELINETRNRIKLGLILVNGVIIIVSGGLAYLLAGKTLEPIQEMIEDQKRFVADSSHEIRTPLTSLKIATEVALREKALSPSEAKVVLSDNLVEINKLGLLADRLLSLAQLDSSSKKTDPKKTSTIRLSKLALEEVGYQAKHKRILLVNKIKNYYLYGSETDLVNLLVILLDNAIKYSPPKTKVLLTSKKTGHTISIFVTDQGSGIQEANLSHLFERFYRVDKSRTGATGFGLGLSIAKRIVDMHRGTLTVVSKVGHGSTFEIKLPRDRKN